MGRRWVGAGGVEVEAILLDGRPVFRLRRDDYLIAYCRTIEELAAHVDLSTLTEAA